MRRTGAILGVLAILVQCLFIAAHRPAVAATLSPFPFQEAGAWCGAIGGDGADTLPDTGAPKSPAHGAVVCPICQTLHMAATGLLPILVALVVPVPQAHSIEPAADTAAPAPFGSFAANPRAPPALL